MTDDSPRRTLGIQQGPRARQIVRSVRDATLSELTRVGYAKLTIGGVARAAGVSRSTIYRRWPSKADLVDALMLPTVDRLDATPRSGHLARDLTALIEQLDRNVHAPDGAALVRVLTSSHPELDEVSRHARARARAAFQRVFEDAVARGELRADTDVAMAVHLAFAGAVVGIVGDGDGMQPDRIARLVTLLLEGVRAR